MRVSLLTLKPILELHTVSKPAKPHPEASDPNTYKLVQFKNHRPQKIVRMLGLVPYETEKLLISQIGFLAQRRLARGVRLNEIEATALIANNIQELIRDGVSDVKALMEYGKSMLGRRHVLPSVKHCLSKIHVEGTFRDGTHLVTINEPINSDDGDITKALYGSFLPIPSHSKFPPPTEAELDPKNIPGAIVAVKGTLELNKSRKRISLKVENIGNRIVEVGSHYHMIEVNPQLRFDRIKAYGYRLDIPSGGTIVLEPGSVENVNMVEIGGFMDIQGGNGIASGGVDRSKGRIDEISRNLEKMGFANNQCPDLNTEIPVIPFNMCRSDYAAIFGPTVGDLVRLGDTEVWVKVERDFTVYGDECKLLGSSRNLCDGMGQSSSCPDYAALDLVITNVLIIDYTGIYKADIGVKNGNIIGIGKAGNPGMMNRVDHSLRIGVNTDVIAGEGKIVTYGAIDSHMRFSCPQQAIDSLSSGITTIIGGGTGSPTSTSSTPSATYIRQMLQAVDKLPLNFGIIGKGNNSQHVGLEDQCIAGVIGLGLHENWGTTPTTINRCLEICDKYDIQCLIHTDTRNESGFVESIGLFEGQTIHACHTEGAGGGHTPDNISIVGSKGVLPSSSTPTRPYTHNTINGLTNMLIAYNLPKERGVDYDIYSLSERIRPSTIAAEDLLHDIGAISMMSSGSQEMGRCGEVIQRTWQTASINKVNHGPLEEDMGTGADNFRVKRYIAKYTINPAVTHGMSHIIGSIEVGKLADLVLWDPAQFGTKPTMVLKSGLLAYSQMGAPNASIPGVQPIFGRLMFAPLVPTTCITFVSQSSIDSGTVTTYDLRKRIEPVRGCRNVSKRDMKLNDATPEVCVDPETYLVEVDGRLCKPKPASALPLSQNYYLY